MSHGGRVRWYKVLIIAIKKLLNTLLPADLEHSMVLAPEKWEQD